MKEVATFVRSARNLLIAAGWGTRTYISTNLGATYSLKK